ncbi:MAG: nucleotidyltransferase family protein [Desulfobacterales bacterium]
MPHDEEEIPCLVLAGDRNAVPLYAGHKPGPKALIRYGQKTSLEYVLDVLKKVRIIRETLIIGSTDELADELPDSSAYRFLPGDHTMAGSLLKGLEYFSQSPVILALTADLPLITQEAVNDFLAKTYSNAAEKKAFIFLSIVPDSAFVGPYAHAPKKFVTFRDVSVCHGNLALLSPAIRNNTTFAGALSRAYKNRKNAAKALLAAGPIMGLAFIFGIHLFSGLTLQQTARMISWRLGVDLVPVVTAYPEISLDVDEPEDHTFVKRLLGQTAGAG